MSNKGTESLESNNGTYVRQQELEKIYKLYFFDKY